MKKISRPSGVNVGEDSYRSVAISAGVHRLARPSYALVTQGSTKTTAIIVPTHLISRIRICARPRAIELEELPNSSNLGTSIGCDRFDLHQPSFVIDACDDDAQRRRSQSEHFTAHLRVLCPITAIGEKYRHLDQVVERHRRFR